MILAARNSETTRMANLIKSDKDDSVHITLSFPPRNIFSRKVAVFQEQVQEEVKLKHSLHDIRCMVTSPLRLYWAIILFQEYEFFYTLNLVPCRNRLHTLTKGG